MDEKLPPPGKKKKKGLTFRQRVKSAFSRDKSKRQEESSPQREPPPAPQRPRSLFSAVKQRLNKRKAERVPSEGADPALLDGDGVWTIDEVRFPLADEQACLAYRQQLEQALTNPEQFNRLLHFLETLELQGHLLFVCEIDQLLKLDVANLDVVGNQLAKVGMVYLQPESPYKLHWLSKSVRQTLLSAVSVPVRRRRESSVSVDMRESWGEGKKKNRLPPPPPPRPIATSITPSLSPPPSPSPSPSLPSSSSSIASSATKQRLSFQVPADFGDKGIRNGGKGIRDTPVSPLSPASYGNAMSVSMASPDSQNGRKEHTNWRALLATCRAQLVQTLCRYE
jgi:hypothetical protein